MLPDQLFSKTFYAFMMHIDYIKRTPCNTFPFYLLTKRNVIHDLPLTNSMLTNLKDRILIPIIYHMQEFNSLDFLSPLHNFNSSPNVLPPFLYLGNWKTMANIFTISTSTCVHDLIYTSTRPGIASTFQRHFFNKCIHPIFHTCLIRLQQQPYTLPPIFWKTATKGSIRILLTSSTCT